MPFIDAKARRHISQKQELLLKEGLGRAASEAFSAFSQEAVALAKDTLGADRFCIKLNQTADWAF